MITIVTLGTHILPVLEKAFLDAEHDLIELCASEKPHKRDLTHEFSHFLLVMSIDSV